MKVTRKDITLEESQANLNKKLSLALSKGGQIIFSCQQCSPAMQDLCCAGFPKETFEKGGKGVINDESAAAIITDEDSQSTGMAVSESERPESTASSTLTKALNMSSSGASVVSGGGWEDARAVPGGV